MMIVFVPANSADPDEKPLYVAFHLGLHCFLKYPFRDFQNTKGKETWNLIIKMNKNIISNKNLSFLAATSQ